MRTLQILIRRILRWQRSRASSSLIAPADFPGAAGNDGYGNKNGALGSFDFVNIDRKRRQGTPYVSDYFVGKHTPIYAKRSRTAAGARSRVKGGVTTRISTDRAQLRRRRADSAGLASHEASVKLIRARG